MDSGAAHDGIELVEITDPAAQPELLRATFDAVLRPSFSTDELPSIDVLARGDADGQAQTIIVAVDAAGPAGAAVYDRPAEFPIGVLSYLASRPGERGRGLGGRLVTRLVELASASTVEIVLGEVHDPRWYAETEDERPTDRLRFYARQGATALGVPWVQPRLGDGERVRDMLLLALYSRPGLVESGVPATWLSTWTEQYYLAEEGRVPSDDEYVALISRMNEEPTIPLIEISRVDAVRRLSIAGADDARTTGPPRT